MLGKYHLTKETKDLLGITLHQIQADRAFGAVKAGELGGWIEKPENLSQDGVSWVYGDAIVSGAASVEKNDDIAWFYSVGSDRKTLTIYRTKNGQVELIRGCFQGSLKAFAAAVAERHGDSRYGLEYQALIAFLRERFPVIEPIA